ncbi:ribosomal protein 63, mitochondrial [Fopius arisanus]|uniref:Ribosomal protein 63, mitochondrial n=1 Tax=Fopius arisanus TaxID=64838 RepID=A0A9R1STQ9_9HYME|nr:PREDICTED: ribosomal protein 63, mitochondrial [Fopius arisanus]
MRLTAFLLHWKKKPPPGHVWRGKHRKVKDPAYYDLLKLRHDFEQEERNMLFLRHPYLTKEQSEGHMKEIKVRPDFVTINQNARNERFNKHFTWQDQLVHLRTTDCWE